MDKNEFLCDISESPSLDMDCLATPFERKAEPHQYFIAIWALEADINNGGFLQYFGNSFGGTASIAEEALRHIGAPQAADIVNEAIALAFPDGMSTDEDERLDRVDEIEGDDDELLMKFEALDARFLEYPDDLTELLFAYVQDYQEHFS